MTHQSGPENWEGYRQSRVRHTYSFDFYILKIQVSLFLSAEVFTMFRRGIRCIKIELSFYSVVLVIRVTSSIPSLLLRVKCSLGSTIDF